MKLYISYYGNYISIVEGIYNHKKDKYIIKDVKILSSDDVEIDNNDKYSLLKEALKLNKSKTRNVVFCLNTRDVIIKSNHVPKVTPKDLDGIMNNEMYEMMSLDFNQYTFSYEVTKENTKDDNESLDVIIAAIMNDELEIITGIFKDFKLNLECIDTMSSAYIRLLKKVEYEDIMMLNVGTYGSMVNIYKEDSLFIHDNIPVRINKQANYSVCMALVDEIKGLMNFYSSRNYGKLIDNIVLIGESNENVEVISTFKDQFESKIIAGIENLFDIEEDIQGDLQNHEISKVCEVLGSMLNTNDKKSYYSMNLLPISMRNKQRKRDGLKQRLVIGVISLAILALPYIGVGALSSVINKKIDLAQIKLNEMLIEYKGIENIEKRIEEAQDEVNIYDMLDNKKITWGVLLNSIEKNIPYRVDLTNINTYYDGSLDEIKEENIQANDDKNTTQQPNELDSNTNEATEITETPIYNQIPNVISLQGISNISSNVGKFVYNLNKLNYFETVELKSSIKDETDNVYKFDILLVLKEGVVSSE